MTTATPFAAKNLSIVLRLHPFASRKSNAAGPRSQRVVNKTVFVETVPDFEKWHEVITAQLCDILVPRCISSELIGFLRLK